MLLVSAPLLSACLRTYLGDVTNCRRTLGLAILLLYRARSDGATADGARTDRAGADGAHGATFHGASAHGVKG